MSSAAAAYSSFSTEGNESYPSFQQQQAGPWGTTLNGQIARSAELNTPFDQQQFEEAKQNGCLPPTCKAYPSWPPPYGTGFIYPSLQKGTQETLLGEERGCFPMASPFIDSEPILPSVNMPADNFGGEMYSPSNLLSMYNCLNTPQALSNKCFGYMPYDATYMDASRGKGAQAKGWLDDPLSPVPITSVQQPVAVQTDIPSKAASDRNENYRPPQQTVENFVSGIRPIQSTSEHMQSVGIDQKQNPTPELKSTNRPTTNLPTTNRPTTNHSPQVEVDIIEVKVDIEETDSDDYDPQRNKCDTLSWSTLFPCMVKSLRGFLKDLLNPNRQPEDQETLQWLFRNNRPYYIVTFMLLVVIICFIIHSVCGHDSQHVVQLFCIFVVAFLVYLALPCTKGQAEAQKITALFILSVLLWGLMYKSNL
jgi:hypothetical protein